MKMYVKMVTDPEWIGKNWKMVAGVLSAIGTVISFVFGYVTAVNATIEDVKLMKPEITKVNNQYKSLNGKVDTLITLYTYQVLGEKEAAKEYVKTLREKEQ